MIEQNSSGLRVVVVGQGYVGLPLAKAAAEVGHQVVGVDLNEDRVAQLNAGHTVVDDISDADVREMIAKGYIATTSPDVYKDKDVIVICVPTPLGEAREPDLRAVKGATESIAKEMSAGTLVILESTTYPGTTSNVVAPILVRAGFSIGEDAYLAYSPERIDPGNAKYGIRNTPKVVGADNPESRERAIGFYSTLIEDVVGVSGSAEAELTKLLENTYRHINIGLVNELAIVCHELGIDVWEVIRAASTKPFGYQAFFPGPGVGGHCIPIDPNYLNHRVREALGRPFRFVELAEDINSSMPNYVVTRAQDLLNRDRKSLNGSKVLLLGVTYKAGIADTRESPALEIEHLLTNRGAEVTYYDPFVETWEVSGGRTIRRVQDAFEANSGADITILLQSIEHLAMDSLAEEARAFLDTRGVTTVKEAHRL